LHKAHSASVTRARTLPLSYTRMLQCVAVCCRALQCIAVRCSALQCVAVWWLIFAQGTFSISDACPDVASLVYTYVAVRCSVLQCGGSLLHKAHSASVTRARTLPRSYTRMLQCVAVCCRALQCVAVRCSVVAHFCTRHIHHQ